MVIIRLIFNLLFITPIGLTTGNVRVKLTAFLLKIMRCLPKILRRQFFPGGSDLFLYQGQIKRLSPDTKKALYPLACEFFALCGYGHSFDSILSQALLGAEL
nr:MAG: hypothetical protein COA91_10395 [Robiginitomaculum sp.]